MHKEGQEVPDQVIEAAEARSVEHSHDGVLMSEESLGRHLGQAHDLATPPTLSLTTLEGLHDRLHGREKATDDPPD